MAVLAYRKLTEDLPKTCHRLVNNDTGVAATAGMIGGMPMLLAVVQDLLTLAAAPITLAYMALCKLYRLQIYCTCTTWRLMRGNR